MASHGKRFNEVRRPISRGLDFLGLAAFVVAITFHIARAAPFVVHEWTRAPGITLLALTAALIVSWAMADAVSGAVHFFADNFGSATWPILGDALIRPFREHHHHPERILEHDFVERSGGNALLASGVLGGALLGPRVGIVTTGAGGVFLSVFVAGLAAWLALTNEIHAAAHRAAPPTWLRWFQASGVILSRTAHQRHHAPPFTSHYCITSGVVDRLIGRAGLWLRPSTEGSRRSPTRAERFLDRSRRRA